MKQHFKYVFVVLTYRNGEDLYDLVNSLKGKFETYHIIVVNSYYDENTENRIQEIARDVHGTFFSVKNNGYGAGNNAGIKYAFQHYSFEFIIIANSDLIVKSFDPQMLPTENAVIGPKLTTLKGKAQNPYWDRKRYFIEKYLYLGHKKSSIWHMYVAQGLNRVFREMFLLRIKKSRQPLHVYAIHGACVLFTEDAAHKLYPVFDPKMFLYYEEAYLARKALRLGVDIIYYPLLDVLHKEDGSTVGLNLDLSKHATNSYLYYYEQSE